MEIRLTPEAGEKLRRLRIREEELRAVIRSGEEGGGRLQGEDGRLLARARLGCVTVWAVYRREADGGLAALDVYAHRMTAEVLRPAPGDTASSR